MKNISKISNQQLTRTFRAYRHMAPIHEAVANMKTADIFTLIFGCAWLVPLAAHIIRDIRTPQQENDDK